MVIVGTKASIPIDKPTHTRIIVSALEIVQTCLNIVVIATVTVGIDITNEAWCCILVALGIGYGADTPRIVGVATSDSIILVFLCIVNGFYNVTVTAKGNPCTEAQGGT